MRSVRQLIESKKAAGRAESYLYLLTLNLRKVSEHFDGRMISTITTSDIERFLAGLPVAAETWNTIRRDCVTLWSYAIKAGFAQENVAKAAERAKGVDEPPGILTPEQAACSARRIARTTTCWPFTRSDFSPVFALSRSRNLTGATLILAGGFIHVGRQDFKNPLPPAGADSRQPARHGCSRLRRHRDRSLARTCANAMKPRGSEQESRNGRTTA